LARQQATREGRNLRYRKIVDQVLLDSPAIFLYHPIPTYAYNQKKIDFLPINPYNIIDYHLIKLKQ
jgi:hypothetical protein